MLVELLLVVLLVMAAELEETTETGLLDEASKAGEDFDDCFGSEGALCDGRAGEEAE